MANIGSTPVGVALLTLPEGVAQCEGIPRKSWMTKCVALKNDACLVVGKGICHNVSSDLIIDSDNQPLGDDCFAVQIAKSLSKHDIPSNWLFQLKSWHIRHVFLNGASLYNQEQMNLFNLTSSHRHSRVAAHLYESSRGTKNSDKIPKKVALLNVDSIANVSTKSYCSKNCLQPFPLVRYAHYGFLSEKEPKKCVTIIHDKIDLSKISSPHFSHKSKHMDLFTKLPISVTRMITYGHRDVRYAYYGLDIFPSHLKHNEGSIAKLLRDVELLPKHSSRELFSESRTAPLLMALLAGATMCTSSLPLQVAEQIPTKPLPSVLNLQLDNDAVDNKN